MIEVPFSTHKIPLFGFPVYLFVQVYLVVTRCFGYNGGRRQEMLPLKQCTRLDKLVLPTFLGMHFTLFISEDIRKRSGS